MIPPNRKMSKNTPQYIGFVVESEGEEGAGVAGGVGVG